MASIREITNLEHLREVALLQEREIHGLHAIVDQAMRALAEARGEAAQEQLHLQLNNLQEQLDRDTRKRFCESSERSPREPAEAEQAEPAAQRGHGPTPQPELPLEIVEHLLPEADRRCPACMGELSELGDQAEEYEEITLVKRRIVLEKHRRLKYRCRCNAAVVTAPGPPRLIPGGRYSTELAVEVACDKYLDHQPLERQRKRLAHDGLIVTTQVLWDQLDALAAHLAPVSEAIRTRILQQPVVHADETWWRVMGRRSKKRWWAWTVSSSDAVSYLIEPSRSADSARKLLADYSGTVVADGYGAYSSLARAGPGLELAHCWAHVRRKYTEAAPFYPKESARALELIGELYRVESLVRFLPGEGADAHERRAALRNEHSRPVIAQLREWAYEQRSTPGSLLRKAIEYMLGLWPGLVRFLDDPRVPLDNNAAERAMRGPVLGRKNHQGSRSLRGTQVAAQLYGLIETAKLCGLDPRDYLLAATKTALLGGNPLLPHDLLG